MGKSNFKMLDISKVLESLAKKRPIFHSEADFQHALAWEIHSGQPQSEIRLEFKPPNIPNRIYTDIWVAYNGNVLAIELKYKTRKIDAEFNDETFSLLNQSAHPGARYDFLKDIKRLEEIVENNNNSIGYCIFLTNDKAYWSDSNNEEVSDTFFRIHEGRTIEGMLKWNGPDKGWQKSRGIFKIKGDYTLKWNAYSEVLNSKFKYLLVKICRKNR